MASDPKRWYYRFPGQVYANGPTNERYVTEEEAREEVRRIWNLRRLPSGFEIWRTNDTPLG